MSQATAKTLGENQIRNSLAGRKKVNRAIRNVLAKPYNVFWPLADTQSESEMVVLLESLLPAARKEVSRDDRLQLRKMQGNRKREARKNLSDEIWNRNPGSKELRNCLAIGINDVSRGLEQNELASVLISNGADPPLLTSHLATLASSRNIPHIVLNNLKTVTKKTLDFPTLTLGFKHLGSSSEESHFHPIHAKISEVFKTMIENEGYTIEQDELPLVQNISPEVHFKKNYRNPIQIYLTRRSKNCRAFVPLTAVRATKSTTGWSEYISFSSSTKNEESAANSTSGWSQNISSNSSTKDEESAAKLTARQQTLHTSHGAESRSFRPMIQDSRKTVVDPLSEKDARISTGSHVDSTIMSNVKNKPVQRYFSLAPLKVKRIQGNPNKKKKQSKKQK